jgi:hypothetical protein
MVHKDHMYWEIRIHWSCHHAQSAAAGGILNYHTHPNVGKEDPDDPSLVFSDGPSDPDLSNAGSPNHRGRPSYILTPGSIYRETPDSKGGATVACFQRWTNSSAGCQP